MGKIKLACFMILILLVHYGVDDVLGKFGGKRSEVKMRAEQSLNEISGEIYTSAEELVHASESIIRGKIIESERKISEEGDVFLTASVNVKKVYKGKIGGGIITVKNLVGYKKEGEEHVTCLGYENLRGRESIFFLKDNIGEEYDTLSSVQGVLMIPQREGILGLQNGDFNMFYNKRISVIEREINRIVSKE